MVPSIKTMTSVERGDDRYVNTQGASPELRNIEVVPRRWRRERAIAGLPYFSLAQTWPLALSYDRATLNLNVSDSLILGGGTNFSVTVAFEDSSDGLHWAVVGTPKVLNNPDGNFRFAVDRAFAAYLRVCVEIEASGPSNFALVEFSASMTYRRRTISRRLSPMTTSLKTASTGDCSCGS